MERGGGGGDDEILTDEDTGEMEEAEEKSIGLEEADDDRSRCCWWCWYWCWLWW